MDNNLLNLILKNKERFVPLIFTEKQFNILKKYPAGVKLTNAEKKSLYTSIHAKMKALSLFSREQKDIEYFINGPDEIIPSRLEEAKHILDAYSKEYDKVFIAGSFLFSKEYGDIDIFIIRKKGYKEQWEKNKHIISLSEIRLNNPIFQSASLISVSNFRMHNFMPQKRIKRKKPSLSELMASYHEAVIEHIRKEKKLESIRRLVFDYNLFCNDKLLNGRELKTASKKIKLNELDTIIKKLCRKLFSETYLYVAVHTYIKTLEDSIKNIRPNTHLIRFKDTYEELIYGKQRSKAEAA